MSSHCLFSALIYDDGMKKLFLISLFIISTTTFAADPIGSFSKATDGIYRGARPANDSALKYLNQKIGIKTIINLQGGDLESSLYPIIPWLEPGESSAVIEHEKEVTIALGMNAFLAPLNSLDEVTNAEDQLIDETLNIMHNKQNQPIFIHCDHGKDRTGLLIALYKVKYEHMNAEAARKEWIQLGHSTFSQIFTGELDDYYFEKVKQFN